METICSKDKCTACFACYNICPKHAIEMQEDKSGFWYPEIDNDKCIDCGFCIKTCPVNESLVLNEALHTYAAISKDEKDLLSSTSGGASSVLSNTILNMGGIVYGCVQESYKDISHKRITSSDEVYKLKGSKYVHSKIGDIYKQVKIDLQDNKNVLFTGTPCQIAGLKNYLGKDYDNLFTVDLVCHGVPSQKFLQEDIGYLFKKYGVNNEESSQYFVSFRQKGKEIADLNFGLFLFEKDQSSNLLQDVFSRVYPDDYYITGFMCGLIFRPNCFVCPYANRKRVGDITIADFWGLGTSKINDSKGVSMVMVNTSNGDGLFDISKPMFDFEERLTDEAVNGNGQLQNAFLKPVNYDAFINDSRCFIEKAGDFLDEIILKEKTLRRKNKIKSELSKIWLFRKGYSLIKKTKR